MLDNKTLIEAIKLLRPYVRYNTDEMLSKVVRNSTSFNSDLVGELTPVEVALLALVIETQEAQSKIEFSKVVSVQRGESSGSKSPKWTMDTADGTRFWVFENAQPDRNTISKFDDAGWGSLLRSIPMNKTWTFNTTPIGVQLEKDVTTGYDRPILVAKRPEAAVQDPDPKAKPAPSTTDAQEKALKRARDMFEKLIVIDTETGGLKPSDGICSIGLYSDALGISFYSLINPQKPISPEATAIHGISNEMVKDAPTIKQVWYKIVGMLSPHVDDKGEIVLTAYNSSFDESMIRYALQDDPDALTNISFQCAMKEVTSPYFGDWMPSKNEYKFVTLKNACAKLGIEFDGEAHNALSDSIMTYRLVEQLSNKYLNELVAF